MSLRAELPLIAAASAGMTVAYQGGYVMPLFLPGWMEGFAIDETGAGLVGTLEIAAMTAAALTTAPWITKLRLRSAALAATGLIVLGTLGSALAATFTELAAARAIVGLGSGAMSSLSTAAAVRASDPDRAFGVILLAVGGAASLLLVALPHAIALGGLPYGYLGVVALCALAVPLYRGLPTRGAPEANGAGEVHPGANIALPVALCLCAGVVYGVGEQALWTFQGEIGLEAGVSLEQMGLILALANAAGLAGAGIAGVVGGRFGRLAPIATGLLMCAAGRTIFVRGAAAPTFALGALAWGLGFYLALPYLFGLVTALDRSGRWPAAVVALQNVGYAAGPLLGGMAMADEQLFLGLVSGSAVLTLLLLLPVLRFLAVHARPGR